MISDPEELYRLLRDGRPHRQVYRGRSGGWWATHGGGEVDFPAVRELRIRGAISSVYSDCPEEIFHIGKTLDVVATVEERQKHRRRKDAPKIYTDGTREMPVNNPTAGRKAG